MNKTNAQSADTESSVAICVLSYDGASELWQPFFDHFFKAWPDCPYPTYLLTNYKNFDHEKVTSLQTQEDIDWTSNLKIALGMMPEQRVLFLFDDFLLLNIDTQTLQFHIEQAVKNDWPYLTLYPNNHRTEQLLPNVSKISEDGVYRCTLVYGLVQKDFLLGMLKDGENAWEFEIYGGQRTHGTQLLSVDNKIFKFHHLLRKGVWMYAGYNYLKSLNYQLDESRPVETYFAYLKRETKEFLFRQYQRRMPPKLIEKIDKRRK